MFKKKEKVATAGLAATTEPATEMETTTTEGNDMIVVTSPEEMEAAMAVAPVKIFYMGAEVIERLGVLDQSGAEECKLSDGTTAFVPKNILGE